MAARRSILMVFILLTSVAWARTPSSVRKPLMLFAPQYSKDGPDFYALSKIRHEFEKQGYRLLRLDNRSGEELVAQVTSDRKANPDDYEGRLLAFVSGWGGLGGKVHRVRRSPSSQETFSTVDQILIPIARGAGVGQDVSVLFSACDAPRVAPQLSKLLANAYPRRVAVVPAAWLRQDLGCGK